MGLSLSQIAIDMIQALGYGGLALGLVIDSFGIPIPSEILIPLAAVLGFRGDLNVWIVFVVGVLAQLAGGLIGYYIGRYAGEPFLERYGKYVLISKKDLARTHKAFEKYGLWITMIGRCVPGVRGLVAYPAGIAEMKLGTFMLFTTVGSAVWTAILIWVGSAIGNHLEQIDALASRFSIAGIAIVALALAWHFRGLWRHKS